MTNLNVFDFRDYREFVKAYLSPEYSPRGTQSALAKHLHCQASYLYQVLRGTAELTEDQAFLFTTFIKMSHSERDYFLCLVHLAKAATIELKNFLMNEMEIKIQNHNNLKTRINASQPEDDEFWDYYFSSTTPSLIHALTSSEHYQSAKAIAQRLSLTEDDVFFHLKKLLEKGLIENKDKKWSFSNSSIHFDRNSKFNVQMQKNRRLESLNALNKNPGDPEHIHFSSLFTIDPKAALKLRELIANFVQTSHQTIHAAGSDEAYIINLDFFRA